MTDRYHKEDLEAIKDCHVATAASDVAPLVDRLYKRHSAGCCLHVVLDDDNCEDDDVDFCIGKAKERGCWECYAIGLILRSMSEEDRTELANDRMLHG